MHAAAGEHGALCEVLRRLALAAPCLLAAAASELGDDAFSAIVLDGPLADGPVPDSELSDRALRHALAMMRGNRSSGCITYFTSDGQMRHVRQREGNNPESQAKTLAEVRRLLNQDLATSLT